MVLMSVNDESDNEREQVDHRSQARWSASKKVDVVMRLLRGESLDEVSRDVGVEAHRLAAWRDEFLEAGTSGLKGRKTRSHEDRRLAEAERKIGELSMDNEILHRIAEKGCSRSHPRSVRDSHGTRSTPGSGVRCQRCGPVHDLSPPQTRHHCWAAALVPGPASTTMTLSR